VAGRLGTVEYEHELYAERLRRKAQAAALATGAAQWTDQISPEVGIKLHHAWREGTSRIGPAGNGLSTAIKKRTLGSLAAEVLPPAMNAIESYPNEHLLSLIEAEHEALVNLVNEVSAGRRSGTSMIPAIAEAPDNFRTEVNRIFESHIVAFHLHDNSRLVPVQSHEMHNAVVEPTLYLLHSQPRFSAAETAYQNALRELRNRDPADAITDAATALQDVLLALGCTGNALGPLLKSARSKGLLKGTDAPLTEVIAKAVDWVSATRGGGEAHQGKPDINMSDAWMVVHLVGALAIRLSEADQPAEK
jgi:hypothetical protein